MIFLGKGDGGFTFWKAPRWSIKVPMDYGGVATGDFDGDGETDFAAYRTYLSGAATWYIRGSTAGRWDHEFTAP